MASLLSALIEAIVKHHSLELKKYNPQGPDIIVGRGRGNSFRSQKVRDAATR
jgi:hypothetical protein